MKHNWQRNVKYLRAAEVRAGDVVMLDVDTYGPTITAVVNNGGDILLQLDTGDIATISPNQRLSIAR